METLAEFQQNAQREREEMKRVSSYRKYLSLRTVGPLSQRLPVQILLHVPVVTLSGCWDVAAGPVGIDWLPLCRLFAFYYDIQIVYLSKSAFRTKTCHL